jgi:predicted phosphodiesterase
MRVVVITDLHANLPALEALLDAANREGYDQIVHTGDVIGIGPYPVECLERLMGVPNVSLVRGNHDTWLVDGFPDTPPRWVRQDDPFERALWANVEVNTRWTHAQIDPRLTTSVAEWPFQIRSGHGGVKVAFQHYALAGAGEGLKLLVHNATVDDLDRLFEGEDADVIFYGHNHPRSDLTGRIRYVNPGSLGCHAQALARYCVAELGDGSYTIEHRSVPYDDRELFQAFERRAVPGRAFFYGMFFGDRFG